MKKNVKSYLSVFMAFVMSIGITAPSNAVTASEVGKTTEIASEQILELYDKTDRKDLEENEIVEAEDIVIAEDEDFNIEKNFEGIVYDEQSVSVSYYHEKGSFNGSKTGDYTTYYKVEPISGKKAYLVKRTISVRESVTVVTEKSGKNDEQGSDDADPDEVEAELEDVPLVEGEIENFEVGKTMKIMSSPVQTLASDSKDSLKISNKGYVNYCNHRASIKYVSQSGKYNKRLVYCLDINKKANDGDVSTSSSSSKIKPEITYCLENGAQVLDGNCKNTKYSVGNDKADYFITSSAIHILNGEVKLSYFSGGNDKDVYAKIKAMVEDAKKYDENKYDDRGLTISSSYSISPSKSAWKDLGNGLYKSEDKFVRTKSGTITSIKYKITGAPSGLKTGEIQKDSSDINKPSDLGNFDIAVSQTDASKESSNFYVYCNKTAMDKISDEDSAIKVTATAYADEKGGRKWTPTDSLQQKITFLEEFNTASASASVRVGSNFKTGSFELNKVDKNTKRPVPGAKYYLYEDKECTELFCKLTKTDVNGYALSGNQLLTQDTYYLKEVSAPEGYKIDKEVHVIGKEYFTIYDSNGKVTQKGKVFSAKEEGDTVGVIVYKKDSVSGNFVKNAGFAVFEDPECTKRVRLNGDSGAIVPVFYYQEDLGMAASEKFVKTQDTYYVKEVATPDGYHESSLVYPVTPEYGSYAEREVLNIPIRCDVTSVKQDRTTGNIPQGDAKLSGATYGLYAAEDINYPDGSGVVTYTGKDIITSNAGIEFFNTGEKAVKGALLATVKTDESGKFNFSNLYYGNYYIKEIKESEGYLLDGNQYQVNFTEGNNKHQNISLNRTVYEDVMKQPFKIVKISDDGENAVSYVKGAEFTVKLQSEVNKLGWEAATTYDVFTTDEKGNGVSKELPYGTYVVRETKVPTNLFRANDFTVSITGDSREPQEWGKVNDAPFKAYIRLVKKDADTGEIIKLAGTKFKIVNMETGEYVKQVVNNTEVSEFVTDSTGTVVTPLKLKYGKYAVEEIIAPTGYVISKEKFPFEITNEGAVKIEENSDGEPIIAVEVGNKSIKGSIKVTKSGEALNRVENSKFVYENHALAGTVFNLIAAEDIYSASNQTDTNGNRNLSLINGVPAAKNAIVATLVTDEKGEARIDNLPLGKYIVQEVKPTTGYALSASPVQVELSYKDSSTEVVYGEAGFVNERVKTKLSVIKTDGVSTKPVKGATYGVYAKEDIKNADGVVVSAVGALVGTAVTDSEGSAVFTNDLPLGKYYVKEVESPEGYLMDDRIYDVDLEYQGPENILLEQKIKVKETPIVVEVSKVDITTSKELKGAKLEIIDSEGNVYASWVTNGAPYRIEAIPAGEYTLREVAAPDGYMICNESTFTVKETGEIQKVKMSDERVKGSIKIYKTDSVTNKSIEGVKFELRDKDGNKISDLVTDEKGYAETDLLDVCTYDADGNYEKDIKYYIVETKAADGYVLDETSHEVVFECNKKTTSNVVYKLKLENTQITEDTPEDTPGDYTEHDKTKITEDTPGDYTVQDTKLPQTGGNYYPVLFVIAGGILISVGIFLIYRRKKNKA